MTLTTGSLMISGHARAPEDYFARMGTLFVANDTDPQEVWITRICRSVSSALVFVIPAGL
jgi:hypothetical protein